MLKAPDRRGASWRCAGVQASVTRTGGPLPRTAGSGQCLRTQWGLHAGALVQKGQQDVQSRVDECGQRTWEIQSLGSPWREARGGQQPQKGGSWHSAATPVSVLGHSLSSVDGATFMYTNRRSKPLFILFTHYSLYWTPFLELMIIDLLTERIFFFSVFPSKREKVPFEGKK